MSDIAQLSVSTSATAATQVTYAQQHQAFTINNDGGVGASRTHTHTSSNGLQTLRCILTNAMPKKKKNPRSNLMPESDAKHSAAIFAAVVIYSAVAFI